MVLGRLGKRTPLIQERVLYPAHRHLRAGALRGSGPLVAKYYGSGCRGGFVGSESRGRALPSLLCRKDCYTCSYRVNLTRRSRAATCLSPKLGAAPHPTTCRRAGTPSRRNGGGKG